jgi:molybdopterin converting factor small subunit
MPTVKFTYALKRFFPNLKDTPTNGRMLGDVLHEIETVYPGVSQYILDEQGRLRQHVNIFIDGSMIANRTSLNQSISENSEICIMQALSGG